MKSQPKSAAPVSRDVVEVVKRKMAPAGPPPAGMNPFHAPKKYKAPPRIPSQYDEFDNPIEDELDSPPRGKYGNARMNHHTESDDYDESYDDYDDRYGRRGGGRESHLSRYSDEEDEDDECEYEEYREHGDSDEDRYDDREYVPRPDSFYENSHGGGRGKERRGSGSRSIDDDIHGGKRSPRSGSAQPKGNGRTEQGVKGTSTAKSGPAGGAMVSSSGPAVPDQRPSDQNPQAIANAKVPAPASQIMRMRPVEVANSFLPLARNNIFNYQPVLRATYRELKHFVLSPCPPGVTARCYIERNRSGTKMLAPFYSICADLEDGTGRELMVCRKILQSRSSHYIFSLKSEDLWRKREQRSRLYLGKLRAVSNMEYVLYDNGICDTPDEPEHVLKERDEYNGMTSAVGSSAASPDKKDAKGGDDTSLYRRELLSIHFNTKSRPPPVGKRGTEVCIPGTFTVDTSGTNNILGKPVYSAGSKAGAVPSSPGGPIPVGTHRTNHPVHNLAKPFEQVRNEKRQNDHHVRTCFVMHERTSRYDPLSSCLVDFKGRANMASVKNCQFVISDPEAEIAKEKSVEAMMKHDAEKDFILQLGKTTDDCFNVDFRYPMSLLQAFAIAVARFDAKLTW